MTITKLKNVNISGFKLVVASVGTGNVAQLAADLFIESLSMEKFAFVCNPAIIPILGPAAFEAQAGDVTTASEIFISEKHKLLILQTRTPVTSALLSGYIKEITKFIKDENISQLIILASSYSHEQHFIGKAPFEYKSSNMDGSSFPGFNEAASDFLIPGSGYARILYQHAAEANIPSVILYKFVSEGDNTTDGIQMCEKVNNYLQAIPASADGTVAIRTPVSWRHLFGRQVNHEIY